MKRNLIGALILATLGLSSPAKAGFDISKIPQSCENLMLESGVTNSILDLKLIEEAKKKVIYNMTNAITGFEEGRTCLNDMGLNIASNIPVDRIKGYGVGLKVGEKCDKDLEFFDYPTSGNSTWIFESFTIERPNYEKICFEIFYGIKD